MRLYFMRSLREEALTLSLLDIEFLLSFSIALLLQAMERRGKCYCDNCPIPLPCLTPSVFSSEEQYFQFLSIFFLRNLVSFSMSSIIKEGTLYEAQPIILYI